jgi:hypothetical protein
VEVEQKYRTIRPIMLCCFPQLRIRFLHSSLVSSIATSVLTVLGGRLVEEAGGVAEGLVDLLNDA